MFHILKIDASLASSASFCLSSRYFPEWLLLHEDFFEAVQRVTSEFGINSCQAIAAQSLKAALPRTGFDVQDGAALGLPTSQASAQYGNDDKQLRLEIVDVGGLGQMAVMAMGMVQGEKEDQTSAEKTWQEGGRTLHQRYDKDGSHAEFKTILKNGLVVSIEGDKIGVKELRGLMSQVDLNGLEGLQRKGKS